MNQIVLRRAQVPHESIQTDQIPSRSDIPPYTFKPDMANATAGQCPLELGTAREYAHVVAARNGTCRQRGDHFGGTAESRVADDVANLH